MGIHALFDILAWVVSATTLYVLRRTWFPKNPVDAPMRLGYLASVLLGAGLGAWAFGTANLWVSGIHEFGRSIAGALVGAILAVELYKKSVGIEARTGAIYALPVVLGIAVGRIGCLLSGLEDNTYGIPTDADWGWDFGDGILRHPVALYESLAMATFAVTYLIMVARKSSFWMNNGFYLAVLFYAVERFVLEDFKPYEALVLNLDIFQLLSLAIAGYALVMLASRDTALEKAS